MNGLGATLLAIAMVLAGAVSAPAAVTVQISSSTLTVTGSAGAEAPVFSYYTPADGTQPGYTLIKEASGVSDPLPALCSHTDPDDGTTGHADLALCEDGGTATLLTNLVVNLGGGDDGIGLQACFDSIAIDAGEGNNSFEIPACSAGALSLTSGAGQDIVTTAVTSGIAVTASLGAGDDIYAPARSAPVVIHGGPGQDFLIGGDANDQLFGDDGNDALYGYAGNDLLDGGAGDDTFDVRGNNYGPSNNDAGLGGDEYRGGSGSDTATLDRHAEGMAISLNDQADDGTAGEGDNFRSDLEIVNGTEKSDTYTGSGSADNFFGAGGDDVVSGGGGDDTLSGGEGKDRVSGDAGNDNVSGSEGDDTVDGGPGRDSIMGDVISCSSFSCPSGNDTLLARDGELDNVQCGAGADSAQVDSLDVVAQDGFQACESVDKATVAGPGGPGPGPGPATNPTPGAAAFSFATTGALSIARGAGIRVTCPAACTFTVSLIISAKTARKYRLGRKALTIATARGTLLAAGSKKVTAKLSKKAKRRLKRAKKVAATLKVTTKDAAGKSTTKTKAIRLGR